MGKFLLSSDEELKIKKLLGGGDNFEKWAGALTLLETDESNPRILVEDWDKVLYPAF